MGRKSYEKENELDNKFIKIPNILLQENNPLEGITYPQLIGVEGFSIYSYLLMTQGQNTSCQVSIKMIQCFFGSKMEGLQDKRTIERFLVLLHNKELIKIINLEKIYENNKSKQSKVKKKKIETSTIGLNDFLTIQCVDMCDKGFIAMSTQLFIDKIEKIGCGSWTTLCLLTKLHNINYGNNEYVGNIGFASPSQEYMGMILGKHYKTIKGYTDILEKNHLIEKEVQEKQFIETLYNGKSKFVQPPNHYIVKFKYNSEHKYFLGIYFKSEQEKEINKE